MVHNKPPPPLEVSARFLQSYLNSILGIKLNQNVDPRKGKALISFSSVVDRNTSSPTEFGSRWMPPPRGWMKLNCAGSYGVAGGAGAGAILRNEDGSIIFSSCMKLHLC